MKTTSITFRIRDELKAQVAEIAKREFRTVTQQVELFVLMGIENYRKEHPDFPSLHSKSGE
jgi:hypothetical protein